MNKRYAHLKLSIQCFLLAVLVVLQLPTVARAQESIQASSAGTSFGLNQNQNSAALDETLVWNRLDTCEWSKDSAGRVVIRPADGAEAASYDYRIDANRLFGEDMTSFAVEGRLSIGDLSFTSCSNLETADLSGLTISGASTNNMFCACTALKSVNFSTFDTSHVRDMRAMFYGCTSLQTLDLTSFNTSKVTDMSHMFTDCSSLTSIDLSSFDMSNVFVQIFNDGSIGSSNSSGMFVGCDSLKTLKISDKCSFRDMFSGPNTSYIGFGKWRSSADGIVYGSDSIPIGAAATYTRYDQVDLNIWYQVGPCKWILDTEGHLSVKALDGSKDYLYGHDRPWRQFKDQIVSVEFSGNISVSGSMDSYFYGYRNLKTVDFGSLDTQKVNSFSGFFEDCPSLSSVSFGSSFVFPSESMSDFSLPDNTKSGRWVSSVDGIAYEVDGIPSGVAAAYTPQEVRDIKGSWNQCGSCIWNLNDKGLLLVKPLDGVKGVLGTGFNPYNYPDTYAWLRFRNLIKTVEFEGNVSLGSNSSALFNGCSFLTNIYFGAVDTSSCQSMRNMFAGCSSLAELDLSKFNTSSVTDFASMFDGCKSLKRLDLSSFDTAKATDISYMFSGCSALRSIDLSSFDTSSVSYMDGVLYNCSSLVSIDLSGFDTSSASRMNSFFNNCGALKELDLTPFDMSAVSSMDWFFYNCTSLSKVKLGPNFAFVGDNAYLPDSLSYGNPVSWKDQNGNVFAAKDVPSFTSGTYCIEVPPSSMPRFSGYTRYETSGLLFDQGNWQQGGAVVLASGANFPDALAASALAGDLDAPIMLTDPTTLSSETEWRIQGLNPSCVYIIGGNSAVSSAVEHRVAEIVGSASRIKRFAGDTRFDTSLNVAAAVSSPSDTVIIATGSNYADALSISPYAYATRSPVILSDSVSGLDVSLLKQIRSAGYSKAIIVGGANAVPAIVESQLKSNGVVKVNRLAGETRYSTSTKIVDFELASNEGFTLDGALLATGQNFPDALSAGSLSGKRSVPLLLVDPGATQVSTYLANHKEDLTHVSFVGGQNAISEPDAASIVGSFK